MVVSLRRCGSVRLQNLFPKEEVTNGNSLSDVIWEITSRTASPSRCYGNNCPPPNTPLPQYWMVSSKIVGRNNRISRPQQCYIPHFPPLASYHRPARKRPPIILSFASAQVVVKERFPATVPSIRSRPPLNFTKWRRFGTVPHGCRFCSHPALRPLWRLPSDHTGFPSQLARLDLRSEERDWLISAEVQQ